MADKQNVNRHFSFIGTSEPMLKIYHTIKRVANSQASVLITGESGTGKELCAQAIHQASSRHKTAFIALNCAAIHSNLIESELFGHVKGAFTGADKPRKGAACLANNGTLFLDEIGEMQLELQAKLLRFVETGTYYSVGDSQLKQANIRFIGAMNRDPLLAIKDGLFRQDLYYRLKVVSITLPPLRQRGEDIVKLSQHFLDKYSVVEAKPKQTLQAMARYRLMQYHWPGNVRQLQNMMHNIIIFNDDAEIGIEIIDELLAEEATLAQSQTSTVYSTPEPLTYATKTHLSQLAPLCMVEREAIEGALAYCDGDVSRASLLLCISKSTIYNRLKCWKAWGRKCEVCTKFTNS